MELIKNNTAKTKNNVNHLKRHPKFIKRGKCNQVPFMGKSVLLARQADVTIMQHVNDSDVVTKLVLEKFRNVLDYYRQRSWKRHSRSRFHRENQLKENADSCEVITVSEKFENTLTNDNVHEVDPVVVENMQEERIEYDAQKFLRDALGDEINNYPTSNSDTDTYKSNLVRRQFDDDYSIGTSNISTLLSQSNSSYSHFSRKLLRCNTYASSSMYDRDAYEEYQPCEEDCKATQLINEAATQHQIIIQTSKALNLCLSKELQHSVEYVEAEKILLLAIEKREALLKELKSLEYEDIREDRFCLGFVEVSNITVPLINQSNANSFTFWIFAVVSCGTQVFATEVVPTSRKTCISFKKTFKFDQLSSDFEMKIRLYGLKMLKTKEESTINSETETITCPTPNKFLGFYRSSGSKRFKQYHSYERRQPSFSLHGTVIVHITELKYNTFLINKVPNFSPLEGNLNVKFSSSIQFLEPYDGFLTVASEAGGPKTWNYWWCRLTGYLLQFWSYPQDQVCSECIFCIDLRYCVIAYISRVDRELCAKSRTLLIETGSTSECTDENSVIQSRKLAYSITRHYLSADCVEEMEAWQKRLNSVIFALRNWNCMKYPLSINN